MRLIAFCTLLAAFTAADVAHAREPTYDDYAEAFRPNDPPPPAKQNNWYGWQTLIADGAALTIFGTAPTWPHWDGAAPILVINTVAYLFLTPVIHSVQGNNVNAGVSVALRLTVPLITSLVGIGIATTIPVHCTGLFDIFCGLEQVGWGAFGGFMAGAGGVALVDAFVLAWRTDRVSRSASSSWTISPTAMPSGGGLSFIGNF